jgi:hypothetical protein
MIFNCEKSPGEQAEDTMKLAADDVPTLVVPGCGHLPARRLLRRRWPR